MHQGKTVYSLEIDLRHEGGPTIAFGTDYAFPTGFQPPMQCDWHLETDIGYTILVTKSIVTVSAYLNTN